MVKEFTNFIREKGVVGLAVGIITGGAVSKMVTSIVENLINPMVGAMSGAAGGLSTFSYTVPFTEVTFKYGAVLTALIDLIAVLVVVYLLFVKSPLNKIDRKKE